MSEKLEPERPFLLRRENRYLWYILILPIYLLAFFVEEQLIDPNDCWVSYLPIDDKIPFLEGFIVPYVLWFPFLFAAGLYLLFRDHDGFKRYMTYIGAAFLSITAFYAISPNMQALRPEVFPRENFFTWMVSMIYAADTNTNVCPSIHVMGSAAVIAAVCENRQLRKKPVLTVGVIVLGVLISLSTVFVKQHSLLDILTAAPYAVIIWFLVYRLPGLMRK